MSVHEVKILALPCLAKPRRAPPSHAGPRLAMPGLACPPNKRLGHIGTLGHKINKRRQMWIFIFTPKTSAGTRLTTASFLEEEGRTPVPAEV